jgi:hypothetical protein
LRVSFGSGRRYRAFTSLCDVSLRRNGLAAVLVQRTIRARRVGAGARHRLGQRVTNQALGHVRALGTGLAKDDVRLNGESR